MARYASPPTAYKPYHHTHYLATHHHHTHHRVNSSERMAWNASSSGSTYLHMSILSGEMRFGRMRHGATITQHVQQRGGDNRERGCVAEMDPPPPTLACMHAVKGGSQEGKI
jgi:hypothetical protein